MKHLYTFLLTILAIIFTAGAGNVQAQITSGYTFSVGTSIYGGDLGFSYTTVIGANKDNASSGVINFPSGFTFNYGGQTYTQFSVTENGLMTLGGTALTGNETSNSMASAIPGIKIAPYWDDLTTGTNGYVKYAYYSGILYINWRVTVPKNITGAVNAEFQVRLSSGGGISFYYGSTAINTIQTNPNGYSIGIGYSDTDFASVTVTGTNTATIAYGTANDNNTQSMTAPLGFSFTPDLTAPTISAETIPNMSGTGNRTLTKTISDAGTHVPVSGTFVPRIYFKKITDVSYVSTPGVLQTGNGTLGTWLFTVDHSLLGGVAQGDIIQYFVAAQDQSLASGHYNVSSSPSGAAATDVNTITTPPVSPNSYVIPMEFSGTITVGTGGDYASLTNPGGLFEQLNAGTVTGNVTVNVLSDLTAETGATALNAWAEGAGGPFTVTINPAGARTISGTSASTGLIRLNGAKNFIIDGLNTGGNSLTILNLSTLYTTVNITGGSSYNKITNTTLTNSAASGAVVTFGVPVSGTGNNGNTISSCIITSSASYTNYGFYFNGSSLAKSYDNIIDNNKIINFANTAIYLATYYARTTISNNEIYNSNPAGTSLNGIYISNYYGGGTYNIFNNFMHDFNPALTTSTGTINGIYYYQGSYQAPYDTLNIYNNVITLDAITNNTNLSLLNGIYLNGGGYTWLTYANIYYNSIYIGGTGITSGTSNGIRLGGGSYYTRNTVKNNAIYNARTGGSGKHYGVSYYYSNYLVSDNNDIYANGTNGVLGRYLTADYTDLTTWQAASSQDANSYSGDPGFTSPTNLEPDNNNPFSNYLNDHGTAIAGIDQDILGNARSTTPGDPTDIGAYEFTPVIVTFTISGNAGHADAVLTWNDGGEKTATANGTGDYSFIVSFGWSGTVTPSYTGWSFSPVSKTYSNVLTDQVNQDYIATAIVFTISGNAGYPNALLSWNDGGPQSTTADGSGLYSFTVSYNWSGTVTPSFTGITFTPENIVYTNVLSDKPNQDYTSAPTIYTISGNAGIGGAILTWNDGGSKITTADGTGDYSFTVSYNWSGTVTPLFPGFSFTPAYKTYTNVLSNKTAQNYTAALTSYIILGNAGTGGATLSWFDGAAKTTTATSGGDYYIVVPYDWSGTVTPSLGGFTFTPVSMNYTNVTSNIVNQDYTSSAILYTISGNTGIGGVTLSWNDAAAAPKKMKTEKMSNNINDIMNKIRQIDSVLASEKAIEKNKMNSKNAGGKGISYAPGPMVPKTLVSNPDGSYSFQVSWNWTGTVTPSLTGYTFTPLSIDYTNVLSDQTGQDYTAQLIHYTISGIAPAGTIISWVDGTPQSITVDGTSVYSISIPYNWSGNIVPSLTGHSFTPAGRTYTNTISDQVNQDYLSSPLPADLVGYWTLNEFTSGNYSDLTGTNNGTGTTTPIAGLVNGAQQFNGTTDKIDVPANTSFDFAATDNFSIEYWYKGTLTSSSNKVVLSRYLPGVGFWYTGFLSSGNSIFYMTGGGTTAAVYGGIITDGNWHHIAATRNGTTGELKIYVDGTLKASTIKQFTVDFSSPTAKLSIGNMNNSYLLNGTLDEAAVYNTELSQAQVALHYNNGILGYFYSTPPTISSQPTTIGSLGDLYMYDVNAIGFPEPVYSLTTFPVGMTINPLTGLIQWTPAATGNYDVSVQASNGVNPVSTQSFVITVSNIPAGMAAYWKLDETSGGSYSDLTGVNNGTGTTTPVAGLVAGAQQFNGTTDKIDVPANTSFDFAATDNFSIEYWYKGTLTSSSNKVVLSRYLPGVGFWYTGFLSSGNSIFYMTGGGTTAAVYGGIITDGNWHHIAATRNGTTGELKIYVDGTLKASTIKQFTVDFSSPTAKLSIGNMNNSYLLNGTLDEAAIFNKELTAGEITTYYNNGLSGIPLAKKNVLVANPVFERFDALSSNNKISLNWITKTETPGVFEVNRTKTGKNEWVKIGSVPSSGTKDFQFKDESLSGEGKYSYMIKYLGKDGGYAYSETSEVELLPVTYNLYQNYPNPFNPSTTIKYQIPYNSTVSVIVYSAIGEKVAELVNGVQAAGTYNYVWNAGRFASGVYILRLQANGTNGEESFTKILKLMLVK